jgi:hypothetical protein
MMLGCRTGKVPERAHRLPSREPSPVRKASTRTTPDQGIMERKRQSQNKADVREDSAKGLDCRCGEIGISAVAAAVQPHGNPRKKSAPDRGTAKGMKSLKKKGQLPPPASVRPHVYALCRRTCLKALLLYPIADTFTGAEGAGAMEGLRQLQTLGSSFGPFGYAATASTFSSEKSDRLRCPQHDLLSADELAALGECLGDLCHTVPWRRARSERRPRCSRL